MEPNFYDGGEETPRMFSRPSKSVKSFVAQTIRIPASLHRTIHREAQKNRRSMSAQIELDLEKVYGLCS